MSKGREHIEPQSPKYLEPNGRRHYASRSGAEDDTSSEHESDTTDDFETDSLDGNNPYLRNNRPRSGSLDSDYSDATTFDFEEEEEKSSVELNASHNENKLLNLITQLKSADPTSIGFHKKTITSLLNSAHGDEKERFTRLLLESRADLPTDMLESISGAQSSTEMHYGPDIVAASENPATHAPSPLQMASPKLDEAFRKALEEKFQGNLAVVEPILKLLAARTPQASKAAAKEVRRNAGENEKQVSEVYHEVFKLCEKRGGSNIAHSQLEGSALKIEIDGVRITCQPDPSGKHKFQLPNNELTKPIMIRCNQTDTILVLGPPNGQAVEVIPPVGKTLESIKAQCMFDVEHYKAEAGKSQSHFTAATLQSHEQHGGGNLSPPHMDTKITPRPRSNSI